MHHISIITPTGHGDLLDPCGHRHVGSCDADEIGCCDAYLEYGEEIHESVFQFEAAERVLEWAQSNSAPILDAVDSLDGDPETLDASQTEWGAGMLIPPSSFKH